MGRRSRWVLGPFFAAAWLEAASVKVMVTDALTSAPLPGAIVTVHRERGQTSAAGACELEGVAPGKYPVSVSLTGYVAVPGHPFFGPFAEIPAAGDAAPVRIRLQPAGSVEGVVRTEDGQPLPGVQVVATQQDRYQAVTDAKGTYKVTGLPPGDFTMSAEIPADVRQRFNVPGVVYHPQAETSDAAVKATLAPRQELRGIDFRVRRIALVSVTGTVMDGAADSPLDGGEVTLEPEQRGQWLERQSWIPLRKGGFRFDGVRPGKYWLMVRRKPGYGSSSVPLAMTVSPAGGEHRVVLPAPVRLEGRVLTPPIAPFEVSIDMSMKDSSARASARPDAQGRFVLEDLIPGSWFVHHGLGRRRMQPGEANEAVPSFRQTLRQSGRESKGLLEIQAGENAPIELTLELRAKVKGVVTDAQGQPLARTWVAFEQGKERSIHVTDDQGRFDAGKDPGEYKVSVPQSGLGPEFKSCASGFLTVRVGTSDISGLKLTPCR